MVDNNQKKKDTKLVSISEITHRQLSQLKKDSGHLTFDSTIREIIFRVRTYDELQKKIIELERNVKYLKHEMKYILEKK